MKDFCSFKMKLWKISACGNKTETIENATLENRKSCQTQGYYIFKESIENAPSPKGKLKGSLVPYCDK